MPANDWDETHKADVAAALKKGKTAPKEHAIACTVVRLKDGSHRLCAAVVASKAAAMVREARSAGGKVISSGHLFCEDDKPVFEVSEGALPAKAKWTEGAAAAGVPLANALIRPAPGAAVDAEPGAEPEAPTAPPADGTAAVRETLAKLVPTVQRAVKDHPERKQDLLQPIARCKEHIDKGQADEAKAALKEVVALLKGLGQTSAPQAPPAPPPSHPDNSHSERDAFMARAKTLKAAIDQLHGTDPARAAELTQLLVKAAASAKAKDLAAAAATLDTLEAGLKASSAEVATDSTAARDAFMARAKALKGEIDQMQAADPGRAAELAKLLIHAAASAKAKDLAAAEATLDEVEAALDEVEAALVTPSAEEAQTAVTRWQAQRALAAAKLADEIKVVLAIQDPLAAKAELELKAVLRQLNGKMETQRQATEMERYLLDDDVVAEVCELAFDLKTPLLKVLREIKPQLTA